MKNNLLHSIDLVQAYRDKIRKIPVLKMDYVAQSIPFFNICDITLLDYTYTMLKEFIARDVFMFAQRKDYYRVEESSMEEFLQAIEQQKSKSSQFESSKFNHLEKKFLESFNNNKK